MPPKRVREVRKMYKGYPYHEIHTTSIVYSWGQVIYHSLDKLKAAINKKKIADKRKG